MPRKQNRSNPDYFAPFPKALRSLMEETGVTQQDVADKIGKTRQAVSYYTDGSSSPDRKTLCQIADFFGVSTDYLLGQTDMKTPDTTVQAICAYTGLDESAVAFLHDENSARDGQSPVALLLNTLLQRTLPGGEDIRPAANIRGLAGAIIDLRMTVDDMRGLSLSDVKQTHGNESGVARYAQMTYSDAFNYRVGAVKDLASEVFSILLNAITDEKNTEKYLQDLERQYWEDLFKDGEDNGTTEKQP